MSYELLLDGLRRVPFPYPLLRAGSTRETCRLNNNVCFQDRLEVCIRLSAEEEFAMDEIDGRSFRTPFPHIFFKYPFHRLRYSYGVPRNTVHFCYSLDAIAKMRAAGILPNEECFHLPLELTDRIQLLVRRFTELLNRTLEPGMLERLDITAFELLAECLMLQRYPKTDSNYCAGEILAIASRLKQNFRENPDFAELARNHGMSLRSFFRRWSEHFEESPTRFIQKLKVDEAARLLRETGMPVASVAAFVNLGDTSYFSKVFRKWYGVSPGKYRAAEAARALLERVGPPPTDDARIW